jgi:hypothetical protein
VGTIFGIYKGAKGKAEFPLQPGTEQVSCRTSIFFFITLEPRV